MSKRTIKCNLSGKSIRNAIKELKNYENNLQRKNQIFVQKLADAGILVIRETMESIVGASIRLTGDKVLFLEFSAGITYGTDTYPLPSGSEYGIGTYPGQTHAYDPNGWWYIDESGNKHHSYGNRAYMPMYHAEEAIILAIHSIAKEVFSGS